jgi:hypothetical protein
MPDWDERKTRGGELLCTDRGALVTIGGRAVEHLSAELTVPSQPSMFSSALRVMLREF